MSTDFSSLESRYVDCCRRHGVVPSPAILMWLWKVKFQRSGLGQRKLVVLLDQLKDVDFLPLLDLIQAIHSSDIDAVDILHESPCIVKEEHIMSLISRVDQKLHTVDLRDFSLPKDFLRDLFQGGFACQILKLSSPHLHELDMVGRFIQLRRLNLDFCTSLTTLGKDCFSFMPNLRCLSMCETRVANLWTTVAALSRLPSLIELRFQKCLCCEDTGPCCSNSSNEAAWLVSSRTTSGQSKGPFNREAASAHVTDVTDAKKDGLDDHFHSVSSHLRNLNPFELSSDTFPVPNEHNNCKQTFPADSCEQDGNDCEGFNEANIAPKKYISHHPSPICYEKHYREFMIASLLQLEVLDNLLIRGMDREIAKTIFSEYYEYLPYRRQHKESIVSILYDRERGLGSSHGPLPSKSKQPFFRRKNQCYFSKSFCAAKLGSSPWPLLHAISNISCTSKEGIKSARPRQFEYHPSDPGLMAFGTLDGEVVVINHECEKIIAYMPSFGALNCVLGLCWMKKYPTKVLAGSDSGFLKLFDINHKLPKSKDSSCSSNHVAFENFKQLTSVHVNSTDEQFLVSGYTGNIALYDMNSGKRLQIFKDMHREPINVAKFAHHSPFMFATSSFDHDVKMWDLRQRMTTPCYTATSSRGNVMVCFSPDDLYLLVSAVDNKVKQLLAVDGRPQTYFEIASSGSSHNYTRSYYMNGRDYIISGSSDEHVVRICCAQTGRRLRDVYFEDRNSGKSMFIQSLRSDPFGPFKMGILAARTKSSSKCEIVKVNLLASSEYNED
ncbi:hypothetical protein Ancab_003840 [Ancistrocladus abbreviatus]